MKKEKNLEQLTDDEILEGFRNGDARIVREYYYGYCLLLLDKLKGVAKEHLFESFEERQASPSKHLDVDGIFNDRDMENMKKGRVTPARVDSLGENEVFVFGSNLAGMHGGGAARAARLRFGAIMGQGVGLQGQSYAIPTMQGGVETIRPYVDDFIAFAKQHPDKQFLVTPIGCGIAGFDPTDIAPLFEKAKRVENISLPECFWEVMG